MDTNEELILFESYLFDALKKVHHFYFNFQVAQERNFFTPKEIFRERVFAYELYHQIRKILEGKKDFLFTLNGEPDKSGHLIITKYCRGLNPDLIIHRPGEMYQNSNLLAIEIKSIYGAKKKSIQKDIDTLKCLTNIENGYCMGVLIIYGRYDSEIKTAKFTNSLKEKYKNLKKIKILLIEKMNSEPYYLF